MSASGRAFAAWCMAPCCCSRPLPPCCCPPDCAVQEDAVIASSLAQLNAAHAGALLEALVERLQLQPQQAGRLVPWLRSLLLGHGAALAAAPAGQVGATARRQGGRAPAAAVLFAVAAHPAAAASAHPRLCPNNCALPLLPAGGPAPGAPAAAGADGELWRPAEPVRALASAAAGGGQRQRSWRRTGGPRRRHCKGERKHCLWEGGQLGQGAEGPGGSAMKIAAEGSLLLAGGPKSQRHRCHRLPLETRAPAPCLLPIPSPLLQVIFAA